MSQERRSDSMRQDVLNEMYELKEIMQITEN